MQGQCGSDPGRMHVRGRLERACEAVAFPRSPSFALSAAVLVGQMAHFDGSGD